jgi:hypothetical protein
MKMNSARKRWDDENEPWLIARIMDRRWKKRRDRRKIERRWCYLPAMALSEFLFRGMWICDPCERWLLLAVIYYKIKYLFIYLLNLPNYVEFNNGYPSKTSRLLSDWSEALSVYTWRRATGWYFIYYVNKSYIRCWYFIILLTFLKKKELVFFCFYFY